ncbi:SAM-dependent methyltransferase [Halobacteriales archaeon SW_6_65_15]|jgi:ubiquinone/menaquinone biosynthesis C-methylase UbiE|nr:MAG: SAM-dependent methyltransferase [Halobacteriales archaeon SW_6_65_15]
MDEAVDSSPERADVAATYDRIADHFAQTREYAWPEVEEFLDSEAQRASKTSGDEPRADRDVVSVALDLGCGNGRHAELLAERADRVVAADASRGVLETARERATSRGFDADLLQADAARLPLRDETVGLAVYVATLHHLPSRDARVGSLDELARVLTPEGRALVSAWSTAHDRFDENEGFDTTVDWTLPDGETVPRFYHVYSPEEFEADVAASDLELVDFELSSGNCYAVVRGA